MAYFRNIPAIKTSKLVEGFDLSSAKKYNLIEIFVNSKDLEDFRSNFQMRLIPSTKHLVLL